MSAMNNQGVGSEGKPIYLDQHGAAKATTPATSSSSVDTTNLNDNKLVTKGYVDKNMITVTPTASYSAGTKLGNITVKDGANSEKANKDIFVPNATASQKGAIKTAMGADAVGTDANGDLKAVTVSKGGGSYAGDDDKLASKGYVDAHDKPFLMDGGIHVTYRIPCSTIANEISSNAQLASVNIDPSSGNSGNVKCLEYTVKNDCIVQFYLSEYSTLDGDVTKVFISKGDGAKALIQNNVETISGEERGTSMFIPCRAGWKFTFAFGYLKTQESWTFETVGGTTIRKIVRSQDENLDVEWLSYDNARVTGATGVLYIREMKLSHA